MNFAFDFVYLICYSIVALVEESLVKCVRKPSPKTIFIIRFIFFFIFYFFLNRSPFTFFIGGMNGSSFHLANRHGSKMLEDAGRIDGNSIDHHPGN